MSEKFICQMIRQPYMIYILTYLVLLCYMYYIVHQRQQNFTICVNVKQS